MGLFSKVKENVHDTASSARESVEAIQDKHKLAQAYEHLGEHAFKLLDSGNLVAAELNFDVEEIRKLKQGS